MAWDGPQYFSLKVTKSVMKAYIPKGTSLDPSLAEIDFSTFLDFLRNQHGVMLDPEPQVLEELQNAMRYNPYGFKQNFDIVHGTEPKEGQPGQLKRLQHTGLPDDMVIEGVPFMQYVPPVPPVDGTDVHGNVTPAPVLVDPLKELVIPDELEMTEDGMIVPLASGQIEMEEQYIRFRNLYRIDDPTEQVFQNFEFHTNVWIEGDLAGNMNWRIYGNLIVDGHLSAGNIEVHGKLEVNLGIQTNYEGTLRVFGDVKTGYLQMTQIGVEGNLTVDRGILQCDLRVGGNIKCLGMPGAIQGSKVFCLASVQANRAGSDAGIPTELTMPYVDRTRPIRISQLSSGTKMNYKRKSWVTSGKGAFSAQADDHGEKA